MDTGENYEKKMKSSEKLTSKWQKKIKQKKGQK